MPKNPMPVKDVSAKSWKDVLRELDTKTKAMGLIAILSQGLFLGSLMTLPKEHQLYGLMTCALVMVIIVGTLVALEAVEKRSSGVASKTLIPSPLTPKSDVLELLIHGAIEVVCRAVSLPQTPEVAKIRVFIFRKEGNQLVCSHYWAQSKAKEMVGVTRFPINAKVASKVAVVRACIDREICRTPVEPLPADITAESGDVSDDLSFVLAAPIYDRNNEIWGIVDFDAATDVGRQILSTEVSDFVMYALAEHLKRIFLLPAERGEFPF